MELKDIVLRLVGPVDPVGETNTDNERIENLKALCELAEHLVCVIDEVAYRNKDSYEYSVKRSGEYAFNFINKNLGINE